MKQQVTLRPMHENLLCVGAYLAVLSELAVANARMLGALPMSFWTGNPGVAERLTYLVLWCAPMVAWPGSLKASMPAACHVVLAMIALGVLIVAGLIANALLPSPVSYPLHGGV